MNQMEMAFRQVTRVRRCFPKEQCATQGAAEAQMRSIVRRGLEKNIETIHVYRCPDCGAWHVGHWKTAVQ
jgi:hypothetical protein